MTKLKDYFSGHGVERLGLETVMYLHSSGGQKDLLCTSAGCVSSKLIANMPQKYVKLKA